MVPYDKVICEKSQFPYCNQKSRLSRWMNLYCFRWILWCDCASLGICQIRQGGIRERVVATIVWPWSYAKKCQHSSWVLCFAFRSAAKPKIYPLIYIVHLRTLGFFFLKEVLFWSLILMSRCTDLSGQMSKSNTVPSCKLLACYFNYFSDRLLA
jgi:hypothetical protein